ncbi:hypothetical protein V1264_004709 [Littorina saxatilis]|uniref:Microtubule-associated protein Jupiter n=1 Tax=Littorina saxatilis TaxID=31220 RepID=A0AAN9B5B6_9CAEN
MSTTSTFSGLTDEAKPSSRVLRPPGGASSNIFGAPDPAPAASAKQRTAGGGKPSDSAIFGASSAGSGQGNGGQRAARDGDDSFSHIFGNTASSPALGSRGTSVSQRVNTHDNLFGDTRSSPEPSTPNASGNSYQHIFGDTASEGPKATGAYNPITGTDYKDLAPNHHALHVKETPKAQKEQPPLPCSDDQYQARGGKMQNVQTSTRVTNPPGGKTTKLW